MVLLPTLFAQTADLVVAAKLDPALAAALAAALPAALGAAALGAAALGAAALGAAELPVVLHAANASMLTAASALTLCSFIQSPPNHRSKPLARSGAWTSLIPRVPSGRCPIALPGRRSSIARCLPNDG